MWPEFLVTADSGVYFATSRGVSVGPEAAIESIAVAGGLITPMRLVVNINCKTSI